MQQTEPIQAPPRIVLADPDPDFRQRLSLALAADFGLEVVGQVTHGLELLDVCLASKPDAVVASSEMDQLPLLEALSRLRERHHAAVVVLALAGTREALAPLLAGPVHACLLKPASPAQVGIAVELACRQFQEQRRLVEANERLEASIANRKLIERAKGLLMKRHRWSEPEAFRRLQRGAMNRRISMSDLARQVLEGGDAQL